MADFTRSVVWRFWVALLLLGDMLVHLVRAATLEDRSEFQACLASPSTCTNIDIRQASLTGTIPTELGLMTSLTWLYLYGNQLRGTIPTEMGLMTSLTTISMAANQLSGTIPTEMGLLTSVTNMEMYGNAGLCGELVSVGSVGTSYNHGIGNTNLGNDCPTDSPTTVSPTTVSPTTVSPTTVSPTTSPTDVERRPPPCCAVGSEQAWRDRHAARIERITRRSELQGLQAVTTDV